MKKKTILSIAAAISFTALNSHANPVSNDFSVTLQVQNEPLFSVTPQNNGDVSLSYDNGSVSGNSYQSYCVHSGYDNFRVSVAKGSDNLDHPHLISSALTQQGIAYELLGDFSDDDGEGSTPSHNYTSVGATRVLNTSGLSSNNSGPAVGCETDEFGYFFQVSLYPNQGNDDDRTNIDEAIVAYGLDDGQTHTFTDTITVTFEPVL